jgi:hypothetical protein
VASKVKRILEAMNADPEDFRKRYLEDTTRIGKAAKPPKASEIAAVSEFQKTGDIKALVKALKVKNRSTAHAAVVRVLTWQAKQ